MSIPSPCINLCRMSPQSGYCEGCLRSIAEITEWGRADDGRKRAILHEVARRKAAEDAFFLGLDSPPRFGTADSDDE